MRSLGTLVLVLGIISYVLAFGSPDNVLTRTLAPWGSKLPGSMSPEVFLMALGLVLRIAGRFVRRKAAPMAPYTSRYVHSQPDAHPTEADETPQVESGGDWKVRVLAAVERMKLEAGVSLHIDRSVGVPFTLVLERCTPGRTRRALSDLGIFLTRVPCPPRVSILFKDCQAANVPWQHMVTGAFAQHLGRDQYRVIALTDRVDVMFPEPDPCFGPPS